MVVRLLGNEGLFKEVDDLVVFLKERRFSVKENVSFLKRLSCWFCLFTKIYKNNS